MPTWRYREGLEFPQYYFLCSACDEEMAKGLSAAGWKKTREGEPVQCNACATKCPLMTKGLWSAEDDVRFAECAKCQFYEPCFFKGRHYC